MGVSASHACTMGGCQDVCVIVLVAITRADWLPQGHTELLLHTHTNTSPCDAQLCLIFLAVSIDMQ